MEAPGNVNRPLVGYSDEALIKYLDELLNGLVAYMDKIQERIAEIKIVFDEFKYRGINFNEARYQIPCHLFYMFSNAEEDADKVTTELAICGLIDAGMDPNIMCNYDFEENVKIPLISKALNEKYNNLVEHIIRSSADTSLPSILAEINTEAALYDHARELIIARGGGRGGSAKRSRYSLED